VSLRGQSVRILVETVGFEHVVPHPNLDFDRSRVPKPLWKVREIGSNTVGDIVRQADRQQQLMRLTEFAGETGGWELDRGMVLS
jgi:hypothetical protein